MRGGALVQICGHARAASSRCRLCVCVRVRVLGAALALASLQSSSFTARTAVAACPRWLLSAARAHDACAVRTQAPTPMLRAAWRGVACARRTRLSSGSWCATWSRRRPFATCRTLARSRVRRGGGLRARARALRAAVLTGVRQQTIACPSSTSRCSTASRAPCTRTLCACARPTRARFGACECARAQRAADARAHQTPTVRAVRTRSV